LTSPQHLSPPSTERIPGHEDRIRRCTSQEGLAIWYFHELGLVDERVDVLVSRWSTTSGDRAAQFLLDRRLLWRRHDGAPIKPTWGGDPMCIQWPIRWYDVLSALVAMTEIDRVDDPGCTDALGILAGKRLKTGGFPVEDEPQRPSTQ
jgi:hypothetical protein